MQADLFANRSQRLKLRLVFRIWREKTIAKMAVRDDRTIERTSDNLDKARTARIIPNRPTGRYIWRNLRNR